MKKVKPDDYFNNGIFEIARFGRHTILKNNMSTKEHTEYEQYLKSEYPKQILKINGMLGLCSMVMIKNTLLMLTCAIS